MCDERSILIVDDEEINRLVAALFLHQEGWHTDLAASGQEALELLSRQHYRCALLDISMPGMSGLELCKTIQRDSRWQSMRLVAYTAHILPDEKATILAAGFSAIAYKPMTRESLFRAISE